MDSLSGSHRPLRAPLSRGLAAIGLALGCYALASSVLGLGLAPGFGAAQGALLAAAALALGGWVTLDPSLTWREVARGGAPRLPASALLQVAVWFGLLGGIAEVIMVLVRTRLLGLGLAFHFDWLWMKPAANALLLLGAGVGLCAAGAPVPRLATAKGAVLVCATGTLFPLLLMVPGLHAAAAAVCALGLAAGLAPNLGAAPARLASLVRRTLPVLLAVVAACAAGVAVWDARLGAGPSAPPPPRGTPNVLLVVWDTVRQKSLGLYGHPRPTTPNLEALARRGVVFEHALTTSPWTLPSHASMFTGRWPHQLFRADETPLSANVPLRDEHPTLAEMLRGRGFDTAGFVANTGYCSRAHGLDRGFWHYEDFAVSLACFVEAPSWSMALLPRLRAARGDQDIVGRRSAAEINDAFLAWLDRRGERAERPFFAYLNYFDAHTPYVPKPGFAGRFGQRPPRSARPGREILGDAAETAAVLAAYEECIAYLDHQLGRLLAELDARGESDTLVIVTSDHGEQFGEHGAVDHANTLYRELLEVPLVLCAPGLVPAATCVAQPVSLVDLPATVLDLVGAPPDTLPGTSLAGAWREPAAAAERVLVAEILVGGAPPPTWLPTQRGYDGGLRAVFAGGYQYIRSAGRNSAEELYDFARDPGALHNLAGEAAAQDALARLRAVAADLWRTGDAAR